MSKLKRSMLQLGACVVAVLLLAGCTGLKPGSIKLDQPGGLGDVELSFVICTQNLLDEIESIEEVAEEAEDPEPKCAESLEPEGEEGPERGEVLVGLLVPDGASAPETLAVDPGPDAPSITLAGSLEVAQEFSDRNPPPDGYTMLGYRSKAFADPGGKQLEWTVDTELALPSPGDGTPYAGPLKVNVLVGFRFLNFLGGESEGRPEGGSVDCFEEVAEGEEPTEGGVDYCPEAKGWNEASLAVSDLRIEAPAATVADPGTRARVPFQLELGTSVSPVPVFGVGATTSLPKAGLRLNSDTTNGAVHPRRVAVVSVPAAARPGVYDVDLTATAPQGDSVAATAKLRVRPPRRVRLVMPRRFPFRAAIRRGIPMRVVMPTAGSRLVAPLLTTKPRRRNGTHRRGLVLVTKQIRRAGQAGPLLVRIRLRPRQAVAVLRDRRPLILRARVAIPGGKVRALTRVVRLRR